MRKNFYELLASKDLIISKEYKKLLDLFADEESVVLHGYFNTVSAYIDEVYFRELPFRGTATCLNDLIIPL